MIKSKIRELTHKLLLPRGRHYRAEPDLEIGWFKYYINSGSREICTLQIFQEQESKGIIILAHPYLSVAKKFFLIRGHAKMYYDAGYDVIIFDFNGFGESPFVDFNYAFDLSVVASHIKNRYPAKRISGHGVSFGASHTISYSTQPDNVFDKIIIENCLDSNLSYYRKRNLKLHWTMLLLMKIFPTVNRNHNYVESISKLKNISKALFIYNAEDDLTTIEMGEKLLNACNICSEIIVFKGQHLNAFQDNQFVYTNKVTTFLR